MDFTYPPHACFIAGTPWVFFFFLANPITQGWIQPEVVVDQAWPYHPGAPKQVFASSMHERTSYLTRSSIPLSFDTDPLNCSLSTSLQRASQPQYLLSATLGVSEAEWFEPSPTHTF